MDRDIPAYNQLVVGKIQQKNLELHYQRLQNIKAHHSRLYPLSSQHNRYNRKAIQQQEDKKTEIQKQNVMLFNKMVKIMKRNDPCNQPNNAQNHNGRPSTELSRLTEQNRTMYERIDNQKPTIDRRKLQEERKKQENILKFLGKYSAHAIQNSQPQSLRGSQADRQSMKGKSMKITHYLQRPQLIPPIPPIEQKTKLRYGPFEFDQQVDEQELRIHMEQDNRARRVYSSTQESASKAYDLGKDRQTGTGLRIGSRNEPKLSKDIILFKHRKEMNNQLWEVSIVRSHNSYQIRARVLGDENNECLSLQMSEQEGNELLELNNYNYKAILNKLEINDDGKLDINSSPEEEKQQSTENIPEKKEQKKAVKQNLLCFNSSHISQQNEEESYRPADSVFQVPSLCIPEKRQDSLGPEEDEIAVQNFPIQQKSEETFHEKAKFQRQQLILEKQHNKQKVITEGKEITAHQVEVTFGEVELGGYQQALEEQIL